MTDDLTPLWACILTSLLAALAIWAPLYMQYIIAPHNAVCFGPFSDAQYHALLTIRYQTWATSLSATGLCIAVICWLTENRRMRTALIATFAVWKTAAFYADTFASPVCWESYSNDTPLWDERFGAGLAFLLQPVSFIILAGLLIGVAGYKWVALLRQTPKTNSKRGN